MAFEIRELAERDESCFDTKRRATVILRSNEATRCSRVPTEEKGRVGPIDEPAL